MKLRGAMAVAVTLAGAANFGAAGEQTRPPAPQTPSIPAPRTQAGIERSGDVHAIQLPTIPPDLPPGPGLEAVNAACVMCHSTRYLTMQPAFGLKTWQSEVEKMRKVFGAPVSDQQAGQIVQYLMSIRGKDAPTTQP